VPTGGGRGSRVCRSSDGRAYALAIAAGAEFWRCSTADAVYAQPLVIHGAVYTASSDQTLTAVDALSGRAVWELEMPAALGHPPVLVGDVLLLTAHGDLNLYAVSADSGQVLWHADTGDWIAAQPMLAGEVLYLLGKDGTVLSYALPRRQDAKR